MTVSRESAMSARDSDGTGSVEGAEPEDGVYRVTHDGEGKEPLSTTVVLALSEAAGIDPAEFQLYTYVDPDSLDALFVPIAEADRECASVEFVAHGHRVTIHGSGEIEVRRLESEATEGTEEA